MDAVVPVEIAEEELARASFFADLTVQERARVAALCRVERHSAGDVIYRVGEQAVSFYVLVEGTVRFSLSMGTRQTNAGQLLRRGDVFGWAALIEGTHVRIATAAAMSPVTLLAIDGAALDALMEDDHTIGYRLHRALVTLVTGTLAAFAAG